MEPEMEPETRPDAMSISVAPAAPTAPIAPATRSRIVRFLSAPLEGRSYANLLYLLISFPLGLAYFIFLAVGLSLGVGLTIVWIGLPILAVVIAGSWGMAALERWMAIHMLGVTVPPMTPAVPAGSEGRSVWQTVTGTLSNPVTWKGMGYLLIKFPLGLVSFIVTFTLMVTSLALMSAPVAYLFGDFYMDLPFDWPLGDLASAWLLAGFGLLMLLASLNLINGFARIWKWMARTLLGSERFAAAPAVV
jgi:hypothetical protein